MKAITLLTTLAVLACTSIAQAQYFNRGFHHGFHGHHKVVNDVNKVIIEQKVVEFEDSGLRVIGVPINLLELDYYWYYDVHEDKKNQQYRDEVKEELKAELLEEVLKNNTPLDREAIIQEILRDILSRLDGEGGTKPAPTPTPKPTPTPTPMPEDKPTPTAPAGVTELDDAIMAIFEQSCNKCHSGDESEVPVWTAPDGTKYPIKTDGNLSEIPQVVGWAIYKSVLGTDPNIKRMPKGGKPLDGDVINTILEWNIQRCK